MAKPNTELGQKHRCLHCSALFYDMGAEPHCPACDKAHSIDDAIKLKPFRNEEKPIPKDEPDIDDSDDDDDVVVLKDDDDLDDEVAEVIKPKETEPEE